MNHDVASGSGTHPAHPYNLVSIRPPVQHQGRFLLFDQPFAVSKMQRGMQGAQVLHIQASGNMDLYMEHPKRKQSYMSLYNELAQVPAFHLIRTSIRV